MKTDISKITAFLLTMAVTAAGCSTSNNEDEDHPIEYPIDVSFTEYSLGASCQWLNLIDDNNGRVIVMNSSEELEEYVDCTGGSYSDIDFSKQTLLLINGVATNAISGISKKLVRQSDNLYVLDIEITSNQITGDQSWNMALITNKLSEECAIELNVTTEIINEYPIEIPFTECLISGSCFGWNKENPDDGRVILINSNEEMRNHIACNTNSSYPQIDFSKHSLLLASGVVTKAISGGISKKLVQYTDNQYVLNLEVTLNQVTVQINQEPFELPWYIALITNKLSEEMTVDRNVAYKHEEVELDFWYTETGEKAYVIIRKDRVILKCASIDDVNELSKQAVFRWSPNITGNDIIYVIGAIDPSKVQLDDLLQMPGVMNGAYGLGGIGGWFQYLSEMIFVKFKEGESPEMVLDFVGLTESVESIEPIGSIYPTYKIVLDVQFSEMIQICRILFESGSCEWAEPSFFGGQEMNPYR